MAPGAKFEINVDNKAMQEIRDGIRNPSRYAFDTAQVCIYSILCFILLPTTPLFLNLSDLILVLASVSWAITGTQVITLNGSYVLKF